MGDTKIHKTPESRGRRQDTLQFNSVSQALRCQSTPGKMRHKKGRGELALRKESKLLSRDRKEKVNAVR